MRARAAAVWPSHSPSSVRTSASLATDISRAALIVARRNARSHGVADRIRFVETSFVKGLRGSPALLVSNPPYVPAAALLSPDVGHFEPGIALHSGADGLDATRILVRQAVTFLPAGSSFVFEFGDGQEDPIRDLIAARSTVGAGANRGRSPGHRTNGGSPARAGSAALRGFLDRHGRLPVLPDCGRRHSCVDRVSERPARRVPGHQPPGALHVLVIPRRHIATLNDLTADDHDLVGEMVRRAAAIAQSAAMRTPDIGWCSTATATPGRPCSISTRTCWRDACWRGPPDDIRAPPRAPSPRFTSRYWPRSISTIQDEVHCRIPEPEVGREHLARHEAPTPRESGSLACMAVNPVGNLDQQPRSGQFQIDRPRSRSTPRPAPSG